MRYLTLILSLICMVFAAHSAKADRRVAFVVGNGTYKNVQPLPNPPIDAKSMASVLRNVGFEVVEGTNLTRDKMTERLLEFGKKAQGADVAVFFYAGHGIAINGTNYLLPIDADIKSEMDVKLGAAINIDLTLDQTMGDAKVKLVFLDACRDNPFAAKIKSNAGDPQRQRADRPCRNEIRRRHADRVRDRPRADRARRPGRHQQPVHPRADRQHHDARRRDPAGDDQGPRPGQRGDQQGPIALGPHQPDRRGLSQPGRGARRRIAGGIVRRPGCVDLRRQFGSRSSSSGARSRNPTSRKSSTPI